MSVRVVKLLVYLSSLGLLGGQFCKMKRQKRRIFFYFDYFFLIVNSEKVYFLGDPKAIFLFLGIALLFPSADSRGVSFSLLGLQ